MGKKATGLIPTINVACFFLSYTLFRAMLFPFITISLPIVWYKNFYAIDVPYKHGVFLILGFVMFGVVTVLNLFWYSLMLKVVYKMVVGDDSYQIQENSMTK